MWLFSSPLAVFTQILIVDMKTIRLLLLTLCALAAKAQTHIDLSGRWALTLSDQHTPADSVALPGTLSTNGKGQAMPSTTNTAHLARRFSYKGAATYQRTIAVPQAWAGRQVYLHMERTKPTTVWVDGRKVSYLNHISTPQVHPLGKLAPGEHTITLSIDNAQGLPHQVYAHSHATTDDTQTNWNGTIGDLYLSTSATAPVYLPAQVRPEFRNFHISGQHFVANGHPTFLRGKHDACVWPLTGHVPMDIHSWLDYMGECKAWGINHLRFHSWCPPEAAFRAADSLGIYLQPELPFWGYVDAKDSVLMAFLWREGEHIVRTYGAHPSFRLMALGNELSGSIPEMARLVAHLRSIAPDKVYTFGSNYTLGREGVKPGMDFFVTCRVGNEAWGRTNTHTRSSFAFVDAYEGGALNQYRPNTIMHFDTACVEAKASPQSQAVPVISHETGQFQVYPDFEREIPQYTGVLRPDNYMAFAERAKAAGVYELAPEFQKASGEWAVEQYKADIEMDLRTRHMAGYQLLDLQDYPGQGTALVGILDALMQSKGITTPQEWTQWVAPVVPLLSAPAYCFGEEADSVVADGCLHARIQLANYGGSSLQGKTLKWTLGLPAPAKPIASGALPVTEGEGLIEVGRVETEEGNPLAVRHILDQARRIYGGGRVARQLQLCLQVEGTPWRNTYKLWFYPDTKTSTRGIIQTSRFTHEVAQALERGASVLWTPDTAEFAGCTVGGLFTSDYWNYRMFRTISEQNGKPVSPGTLSIFANAAHPLFTHFPTEGHTSWQWWPILKNARPLMLQGVFEGHQPIVRSIDNIERSLPLGLIMEFRVGRGRLLLCMAHLAKAAQWPEGRALHHSIVAYMRSRHFQPTAQISVAQLKEAITATIDSRKLEQLNNISEYK